ncbi:Uncharacterised protein [Serratia marcescens]|nr:Uncharacterised protein [Serratia marcescens]CVE33205.1 Uncharacterised protein [Serratia marcescens]
MRHRAQPPKRRQGHDQNRDPRPTDQRQAAVTIAPVPDQQAAAEGDKPRQQHRGIAVGLRHPQVFHRVGAEIIHRDVSGDGGADGQHHAEHHRPRVLAQLCRRLVHPRHRRPIALQPETQPATERRQRHADKERNTPSPLGHGVRLAVKHRQGRAERQRGDTANHSGDALRRQRPAGIEAAPVGRRRLHQQRHRRPYFAARRHALDQARRYQGDGSPVAGAGVGRRKADHRRAQAHQGNRQDHRRFAAAAIGIGANQNAAQRPHEEADAKRRERQQQCQMRIAGRWKEQYADVNNEEVINTEVKKLQRITERGGEYDLFAAGVRGRYYCRLSFSRIFTHHYLPCYYFSRLF